MKKIQIAHIGEVTIKKHKRSKSIKLRVIPQQGLSITIPYFCAYEEAYQAIEQRKDWIIENLEKVKEQEKQSHYSLSDFPLKTQSHEIHVLIEAIVDYEVKRRKEIITISIPFTKLFDSSENQKALSEIINKIYRKEAKEYIPKRVAQFAQQFGLQYNRISIKNQKTRWGSCSSENNLNFNLNLMKLPQELRDYVILHELAHTIEKNHQKPFWKLLDSFTHNQAKKLDKDLDKFNWVIG